MHHTHLYYHTLLLVCHSKRLLVNWCHFYVCLLFISVPRRLFIPANRDAERRPELLAEEKALVEELLKSAELRPLVSLVEARGVGPDEVHQRRR